MGSTLFGFDHLASGDKDKEEKGGKDKEKTPTEETGRKLPIINPLVRLPNWPSKDHFCPSIFFNSMLKID